MNGVYRLSRLPTDAMVTLDGRLLADRASLLSELGRALGFPDYYGGNWDALEECLADLSWHEGALQVLITHSDALADDVRDTLIEVFLEAARSWSAEGRGFVLYLA